MINRRFFTTLTATATLAVLQSKAKATQRPNLLFIMTDQQRFDALSLAGNTILKTPNMDRIGKEGAYFSLANSQCPVCGPARTSLMTGRSVEKTQVRTNMATDERDITPMPCYDELLSDTGYRTEYYGKWHAPLGRALKYDNAVAPAGMHEWERGPGLSKEYEGYLKGKVNRIKLYNNPEYANSGLQEQTFDHRSYKPNPLDTRYGMEPGIKTDGNGDKLKVAQPDQHGISTVPKEHTITAVQAKQTLAALERLAKRDEPFSLHCSFHCPHSPITPSEPYASMYKPKDMPVPESIDDPMDNSPYINENGRKRLSQYRDHDKIKYMIANYYALVKEIDIWLGEILDKMDELGIAENTMVIFTSDHGEMLGAHGMREKNIFYEESVHVPLMIRFPGRIKAGTKVDAPVSQIDLYATIQDYLGIEKTASDGESLRRYIEGTSNEKDACAVAEWNWRGPVQPNLMVRTRQWKYFIPNTADSKVMNVLYDLKNDPLEMNNLLGNNPKAEKNRKQAEFMKGLLVQWLEKTDSPHLAGVKKRGAVNAGQ
ncbi:sulfatase-like hydrolase/transferase [Pontiella sulfatireligans]|uniref:Arylsulfatase n=1 Tax=Pontiella sulfatireligans TaxID=2750658 RepID=A0A6C2UXF9_9BACT|nr:sulfatase-like hydrolase/transferase [Pontiella sulfatireligans]SPS74587.1 sulfatase S1_57 [Kiritimatiellales bacterium]VGO23546.1 Arylsulfatase [Pontiella sulfatireligans]